MPKFRKKPIVVEAVQWHPIDWPGAVDIEGVREGTRILPGGKRGQIVGFVQTLEGEMFAENGDWIITGVNGEKYPCKPDIFAKTYEPAAGEPVDIGIRVQEEPPEQSNGIRFMTIVRVDRNLFQAAKPKDARNLVRRQFQFALPPLMKVVDEEHDKLNPPEGSAGGVDFGREGGELPDGPAVPGG